MLARRLATLLPAMHRAAMLETTRIHRLADRTGGHTALVAACASTEVPRLEGSMNQYACDGLLTASASRAAAAR